MDPTENGLSIGRCDRCHKDISKKEGEHMMVLAAKSFKLFTGETYRLEMMLCDKCAQDFEKWTTFKGG
jgi:hypothetical protein